MIEGSSAPAGGDRGLRLGPVALLVAVALALRLLYLFQLSRAPLGQVLLGDGIAYDAWARRIAGGDWWGSEVFYQAPLYPYFLGALYAVLGPSVAVARIAQALLGAASCGIAAAAGRCWFDRRSGLLAGWLLACYPPAIFFDGEIQKASLSLFLAVTLLLLLGRLRPRPRPGLAAATGALTGLFALNRENALVLVPLVAGWLLVADGRPWRRRLATSAWLVAGALVVLAPVALRNRALGGALLPTTSQMGTNFYIGNHAGADGRYHPLKPGHGSARYERQDATDLAEAAAGRRLSPGEVSRYWLGEGLRFVREHPGDWLHLLGRKLLLVWNARELVDTTSLEAASDVSWLLAGLGKVLHFGVLAPLAAAGIWLTRRRWRELLLLYLWLGGWTLAIAAFFVFARYRYPMVPALALLAGAGLAGGFELVRRRAWRALAGAGAVVLAAAAVVDRPLDAGDPRAPTYANLGRALDDAGRSAEGARMLEHALELSPGFAEAAKALGDLRLRAGDLDAAEAAYLKVVDLDPENAEAWNNLGVVASRRGRADEAIVRFRRAVGLAPDHVSARFNLARALAEARQFAAAREQFEKLVELAPGDVEGRVQLAGLLAYGGEMAPARVHYERAIALAPERADARFKLWAVDDALGDQPAALAQLRRALELEPRYAARLLALAADEERAGRPARAAHLYRQLLVVSPGQPEATRALARLGGQP